MLLDYVSVVLDYLSASRVGRSFATISGLLVSSVDLIKISGSETTRRGPPPSSGAALAGIDVGTLSTAR
jgi:hypothetical protein